MPKPNDFIIKKGSRIGHSKRGGIARHAGLKWNIDGDQVSITEIAQRLNLSPDHASAVLRKAQQTPGPVTWEKLTNRRKPGRPCSSRVNSSDI